MWQCTETVEELLCQLPPEGIYLQEIKALHAHQRRILERLAIRTLMFTCWKEEHEVTYLPTGAPRLADNRYNISISHTNGYAALCWHPTQPVGIDIELIRHKALRLAPRFMHSSEHAEGDKLISAVLHWSAKETIYKLLPQQENTDFTRHLRIFPFVISTEGILTGTDLRRKNIVYPLHYRVEQDFVLTWSHP